MKRFALALAGAITLLWAVWGLFALVLTGSGPTPLRWVAAAAVCVAVVGVGIRFSIRHALAVVAAHLVVSTGFFFAHRPSHDRVWSEDQSRMPDVTVDGDRFTISDHRAFRYRSPDDWDGAWNTQTYRFSRLVGVDLGVEQFASLEAIAHTFVCFRFTDGRVLVASVEIRKESDESFSPLRGLFRQYEKMVVLGDERDLVELRAVHRRDEVTLHPLDLPREGIEAFLRSLLDETARLHDEPAFYNTLTASCTSTLATHLRAIEPMPLDHRMFVPGYADALAYELGWIEGSGTLDELRERHRIDTRAQNAAGQDDFSARIRAR